MPMSWPVKTKHPRNSHSSTTPSNVFTFTAPSKLEPISGSPSTSPSRSSSSNIAKGSEPPVITLRSAFNATAPANHLPSELVVEILSSGSWSQWQELVALTHICQHWRDIALGTPHLWAEAVRSIFAGKCKWYQRIDHTHIHWPKCLPAFLARSEPFPLKVDLPDYMRLVAELLNPNAVLKPHISRVAHLSVEVTCADGIKAVLQLVHAHIRGLESLRMRIPQRQGQLIGIPFSLDELPSWEDADLPCLHTLAVPGYYFGRAIAVASLRTLVLCKGPRNHKVFLAALERCGPSLESLTLRDWSHPVPTRSDATRTVQLPRLRHLKVALSNTSYNSESTTPALLFAILSFPPTVMIDLGWTSAPGNTRELLPKDLVGLHAPPFFDSMCLHLFGNPRVASLHCYLGDTERLCVQGQVIVDPSRASGLSFGGFPDAHQWPTVTQLAVDLDMQSADGCAVAHGDLLRAFLGGFPNLRRLDLLGKTIGDAKLQMVDAFLDPTYSYSYSYSYSPADTSPAGAGAGKTLAYVCEVSEHRKTLRSVGMVDDFRAQLDALEALLASRLSSAAASQSPSPRLRRLELCIAYSAGVSHPPPRIYPRIQDVSFSTVLTAYLLSIYLPRFRALPGVDEVVFIGDSKARVPGYRVVSRASHRLLGSTRPYRGEKRSTAGRKGR